MALQNIRGSALTYLAQYPEGSPESIPTGPQIGTVVAAMEKRLCEQMQRLDLDGIKGVVLKDARLEVTLLLLGINVQSYKALWMHQLKALEAWADTAPKEQVKLALREAGWLPRPTELALARCLGRDGVSKLAKKRITERFA